MNREVAVVMGVIAKSLATSVAGVNAHRVSAKQMDIAHVSNEALASEE